VTRANLDGLLPLLEAPASHDETPESEKEGGPIRRPFVGPLVISYIVEEGDLGRAFERRELAASGADENQLHERALANLARHVKTVGIRLRSHGSMMAVSFDGDLEATLMLYPTLWTHLRDEIGDELVVAVPARDVLVVSPGDSREGIAELHAVIERVWPRDDHPLTTELFQLDRERWRVWEAPVA
jgi:uncharacterized protein YtpQ (UPF0354 family)